MRRRRVDVAAIALGVGCAMLMACGEGAEEPGPKQAVPGTPTAAKNPAPATNDPASAAPTGSPSEGEAEPIRESRSLMGTVFIISIVGAPEAQARKAARDALDEIARLEQVLSEWIPESEISHINAAAGEGPVKVGPDTLAVVEAGLDVSKWSGGAFDLSWATMHGLYDFRPGHYRVPTDEELAAKLPLINYERIAIDKQKSTVMLKDKGMAIGTGGVAKGYALDRAGAILKDAGLSSFMLFGGGQVQVHGLRGDRPWRVGIQHPRHGEDYFAFLESAGGSISTSGDYEHFFERDGTRFHHIIDTTTGRPARGTLSVTTITDKGIYADALSTAVFILGPKKGMEMLASLPIEANAVIVDDKLLLHRTKAMGQRVVLTRELADGKITPPNP